MTKTSSHSVKDSQTLSNLSKLSEIRASIGIACTTAVSEIPVALATFAGGNFDDSTNCDKEVINTALMPIATALCEWTIILLTPEIVDNSV